MPKLFAWQPNGHGQLSWFVVADDEDEARGFVEKEIARRKELPFSDLSAIGDYEVEGWGTDYYTLTVCAYSKVISNSND